MIKVVFDFYKQFIEWYSMLIKYTAYEIKKEKQ
jgi:hypothetical protein